MTSTTPRAGARGFAAPWPPLLFLALAVLGHLPAFRSLSTTTQCACEDAPQTDWFLAWTPSALAAGRTPLVTQHLNVPDGVNLMWNTLLPLPGLLAAPITLTVGVLASHTVLAVLAFALSATSMWAVVGRWAPWGPARLAAGLLYGFSPYLVAQGSGHLNLSLVALPPLVLLLLDDLLVRQDRSAVRRGTLLGLVALAQLLTTEEVLASTFVMCALGLVVLVLQHGLRGRVRHAAAGLGTAAALLAVLAAVPLAVQFGGDQRVTEPVQDAAPYAADLLGAVVPTVFQLLGTDLTLGWGGNASENGSYLGAPLLLVLVALVVRFRREAVVRFAAVLGVLAWVLSLGERLHVAGTQTPVPLPFAALARLPVLQNMAAVRFSLYVVLCAAVVLAVGLDRLHAEGSLRRLPAAVLAVACLVPLLPAWPYSYVEAQVPAYFTTAAVRAVPRDTVALTYPVPRFPESAPMLWQASAGFRYRSLGGYVITPQSSGAGTFRGSVTDVERLFADVRRGAGVPRSGALDARVLAELSGLQVDSVLISVATPGSAEARRYVTRAAAAQSGRRRRRGGCLVRGAGVGAREGLRVRSARGSAQRQLSAVPTTRAGTPATTAPAGTSLLTTAPAATTAPSPMVTPLRTMARVPTQTRSPMVTGAALGRSTPSTVMAWKSLSRICTSQENVHQAPMVMPVAHRIFVPVPLTLVPWPKVSRPPSTTTRTPRCRLTTPSQCRAAPSRTRTTLVSLALDRPKAPSPMRSAPPSLTVMRWAPSSTVRLPIQMGRGRPPRTRGRRRCVRTPP